MNNRKYIKKEVYNNAQSNPFKWKDIKHFEFQDDDIIGICYDEGYVSENNSYDPHYYIIIERMVLETDEEMAERIEREEYDRKRLKEMRYKNYLTLKKEFETHESEPNN